MSENNWITQMFDAIDRKDTSAFLNYLAPSCIFRFGNMPAAEGIDNIETTVAYFFESINALSHQLTDIWQVPEGIICHGTVSYTRHDNSVLTVPFSNILKGKENEISEYLIFADTSELYQQAG